VQGHDITAQCTPPIHGCDVAAPSTVYQALPGASRPALHASEVSVPPTVLHMQAVDQNVSFKFIVISDSDFSPKGKYIANTSVKQVVIIESCQVHASDLLNIIN
jgi:hypothetical protein